MKSVIWGLLGTLVLTGVAHAVPIVIQVNGPDDKPVANAEVRAKRLPDTDDIGVIFGGQEPQRDTARSDDKGVVRFDWPARQNSLSLPAELGKSLGTITVWASGLGATNAMVVPGDNTVKLARAGAAHGMVRDEKGAPVAGATVRVLGAFGTGNEANFVTGINFAVAEDETAFTAQTDAQGAWEIGNLPLGGRALVQLEGAAYAADTAIAPIVAADGSVVAPPGGASTNPQISIPDSFKQNGELSAKPAATLTGRVLSPAGEPVADVMVWARSAQEGAQMLNAPKMQRTDGKGEFRAARLEAGSYRIALRPPATQPLVADAGESATVKVESGQSVVAPDQKLVQGGTIVLQITDAKTGKPIPKASAMVQALDNIGAMNLMPSTGSSDATGKLQMNVAAGKYRVYLWQPPTGYVRPAPNGPNSVVTVTQGATQTVAMKLEPGVAAAGRIVDAAGKAVPKLGFYLRDEKNEMWGGTAVSSDEKGEWKTQEFAPGTYKVSLTGSEKWELVGPKTFDIPTKTPLQIKVKPLAQTQLSGRIVDSAGNGIAGVAVKAKITTQVDNFQADVNRQAVSDAKGEYTLPQFPTTAISIVLKPALDGYAVEKAPVTTNENNVWTVSDTVLQALSSHLGGTVLNAQNQPQAGVQVLAVRFGTVALSDAAGAWKFDAIAPGEIEIVAVGAQGASAQSVTAGSDDVQLKMQPFTPAKPRDIDGAIAVLDEAWQTSNGRKFYARESLPATVAPYDADAALAMARGGDAKASDAAILQIVQVLALADAERAREWAPQVLATLEKPENKLSAALTMAKALVDAHPDEAKTYLQDSTALYDGLKDDWQKRNTVSPIAVLSAKLKMPDAPMWFERTLELANDKADNYRDYSYVAWRVAAASADWASQVVEAAIKAAPDQAQYAQSPSATASAAIRRLAMWDIDAAQKMLEKYSSLKGRYDSDYEMDRARAAVIIERFKKNQDVEAALKSARELGQAKIRTLSQIADLAPVERRADILREALKLARVNSYQQSQAIRIAWQLLPYDRDVAKDALDEIRPIFDNYNPDLDRYSRSIDVSGWAYAYRDIDKAQSRWLLEREWARVNNVSRSPDDEWNRVRELQNLILAMATVDVPRAQQMIFALPIDEQGGAPFASAQVLARWMLASTEERQTRAFDSWNQNDSEDGLYSNMW